MNWELIESRVKKTDEKIELVKDHFKIYERSVFRETALYIIIIMVCIMTYFSGQFNNFFTLLFIGISYFGYNLYIHYSEIQKFKKKWKKYL